MQWFVVMPAALVLAMQLLLPAWLATTTLRARDASRRLWWLGVAGGAAYVTLIFVIGRWDWLGYWLRFAVPAAFAVAVAIGWRRARTLPARGGRRAAIVGGVLGFVVLLAVPAFALRGLVVQDDAVELAWPLAGGDWYVAHGGNSVLLNQHHPSREQRHALDVVQLNAFGARASGLYPAALDRYSIYGKQVAGPCDGKVVAVADGLPDQPRGQGDHEHAVGNHVVIGCGDAEVVLAHLLAGSIVVSPGQALRAGQPIGRIGNSGNTSEPHLHVHATRRGGGVPMRFDGRYPVRNSVLRN